MKLKLPKATASGHQQIARVLWRNAHHLPPAERLKALKQAAREGEAVVGELRHGLLEQSVSSESHKVRRTASRIVRSERP